MEEKCKFCGSTELITSAECSVASYGQVKVLHIPEKLTKPIRCLKCGRKQNEEEFQKTLEILLKQNNMDKKYK